MRVAEGLSGSSGPAAGGIGDWTRIPRRWRGISAAPRPVTGPQVPPQAGLTATRIAKTATHAGGRRTIWLPVLRTQRNIPRGWLVVPVFRNFRDRNVIYAVTPPTKQDRPEPVNPVTLALAFRKMLDEVNSQSHLARKIGLTRSRVTQLLNLLKLPPAMVAELSAAKDRAQIAFYTERRLRPVTRLASRREKLEAFRRIREKFHALR